MICTPSIGEEQVAMFETVFNAVTYIHKIVQLNKDSIYTSVR